MPDKVTLVRKDGTTLDATPEQAQRLALLGYRPQTGTEDVASLAAQSKSEYYSEPGQVAQAALEGVNSGLTFGATDYISGAIGDEDFKERAKYNPGTRAGAELVGALLPMAVGVANPEGVLGTISRAAPTSLLAEGASALAPGIEGSLTKAVFSGAIEGGAYGGAGAADHAYLNGDPITAEAVLHGIGWGALIGGGLAASVHGAQAYGNAEAELTEEFSNKNAAEQQRFAEADTAAKARVREATPEGALKASSGNEYAAFKGEVDGLVKNLKVATASADAAVKGAVDEAIKVGETADLKAFNNSEAEFAAELRKTEGLYKDVTKAVEGNKFTAATEAAGALKQHLDDLGTKLGTDIKFNNKAVEDLITIRSVGNELGRMPRDVEGFAQMSPAKIERALAALDQVKTLPFPEAQTVPKTAEVFSKSLGIEATDLRSSWRAAKDIFKREGKPATPYRAPPEPKQYGRYEGRQPASLLHQMAGFAAGGKAWVLARAGGMGRVGAFAAYKTVRNAVMNGGVELAGMRAAVVGRLREAAGNYLPGATQGAKSVAPKMTSLAVNLFGQPDQSTKDRQQLAANRIKEINDFAPHAADSLFKAIEPLSVTQPDLAKALHASALQSFRNLQGVTPKDPGVISKLKTIWKPSDVHAMTLSKQLDVFRNPVGEAVNMLASGKFDPIKVQALQDFAPNIWQSLRVDLLDRITQPDVAQKMTYGDQIGLSTMLGLAIHSSMAPEFIATSQQIFLDRNQPLSAKPRMGQGGGLPNPKDNVNATSAQKTEAH